MKQGRFSWALYSVLVTGAMIGACVRSAYREPDNLMVANLPPAGYAGWRIEAKLSTGALLPIDRFVPMSRWSALTGSVPDRPVEVRATMIDPGLGQVDCRVIRVRARMSGGHRSWSDVTVVERRNPVRGTCLLTLSWP